MAAARDPWPDLVDQSQIFAVTTEMRKYEKEPWVCRCAHLPLLEENVAFDSRLAECCDSLCIAMRP
jgi:hypothetical protein